MVLAESRDRFPSLVISGNQKHPPGPNTARLPVAGGAESAGGKVSYCGNHDGGRGYEVVFWIKKKADERAYNKNEISTFI